jgi:monofunctional biosynthetic peptidoglycan transglycosylase
MTVWTIYQIALGAILVGVVWLVFQTANYLHVWDIRALRSRPPATTAFIETQRKTLREEFDYVKRHKSGILPDTVIHWSWIPLDSIPETLVDMALVAEDSKFHSHEGFDFEQIEYAIVANHQAGHPARGASTITQQVAKNLYLTGGREMQRKLREAALTLLLEDNLSKDRILEIYLNVAQFGRGVFGVREAARVHYGKEPAQLTQDEMLSLVCLLPSPERWNPKRMSPGYLTHKMQVLNNYALFKGIKSTSDSTAPDWMNSSYDSLSAILTERRWKTLRKNSGVSRLDSGQADSASDDEEGENGGN